MQDCKNTSKARNVLEFYMLTNKLKHVIRTGWKNWNVQKERLESVAEHVYGTQMLAIAMHSEYELEIDLMKVLKMLAIHEVGESIIGDLTLFDITKEEKEVIEHEAVHNIFSALISGNELEDLFIEFDNHETKESIFAYLCDKAECDIQAWLYGQENLVDLNNQDGNPSIKDPIVMRLIKDGKSWSEMWLEFGQQRYPYDNNFKEVLEYCINHKKIS